MTATIFLVQTIFGFYVLAVMLRFLLQWVRADFYNPLVRVIRDQLTAVVVLYRALGGGWNLDVPQWTANPAPAADVQDMPADAPAPPAATP